MYASASIRDDIRYGYAVGRVRVLDGRLLSRGTFERLLDAPDLREQKRVLADTHVGRYLEGVESANDVERALDASLGDLYDDFLDSAGLPTAVVEYFRIPNDYANLRVTLKARALGRTAAGTLSALGSVPPEAFTGDGTALPKTLRDVLTQWDGDDDAPAADDVEVAVDRALFSALAAAARASKVRLLTDLTELRINLANARLLIRSRAKSLTPAEVLSRLIPDGSRALEALAATAPRMSAEELATAIARTRAVVGMSEEDLADIERFDVAADTLVAGRMEGARRAPGGAEPVLAYVLRREAEVLLLRTAVAGRLSGLDREIIRARVKERI